VPKVMTLLRGSLVALLAAGAAVALIAGFGLLGKSLSHGQIGPLLGGFALSAVGLIAVGVAVGLVLLIVQDEASHPGTFSARWGRITLSFLALAAEAGMVWLLIEFAGAHRSAQAWIVGGAAFLLLGLVVLAWFSGGSLPDDLGGTVLLSGVVVAGEVGLGWLAAEFAGEQQQAAAWLFGGLGLALLVAWMLLPEVADSDLPDVVAAGLLFGMLGLPAATLIGVAVKLGIEGQTIPAAIVAGLLFVSALLWLWSSVLPSDLRILQASGAGSPRPGAAVSVSARLVGLIVPLGTLVWAAAARVHGTAVGHLLGAAAWITIVAVALLVLQGLVLAWLRPGPTSHLVEVEAERAEVEADSYLRRREEALRAASGLPPDEREWRERKRYEREWRERERYEREWRERKRDRSEWDRDPRAPYRPGGPPPVPPYTRDRYPQDPYAQGRYKDEREHHKEERALHERRELGLGLPARYRMLRGAIRPLALPPAALRPSIELARTTGLSVDRIWPRLKLVIPPGARGEVDRSRRHCRG
jgi:hypothetical protein